MPIYLDRKINDIKNEFLRFCYSVGGKVEAREDTIDCKLTDRRCISLSFEGEKVIVDFLNIQNGREVRLEFISDVNSTFSPNP